MRYCNSLAELILGFKVAFRYRFNFFINLLTIPMSVLIYAFLWKAIYAYTGDSVIRGFSYAELVSYYVVSMLVGLFVWVDVDKWIAEDIRKGQLVVDLLRPITYFAQCLWFEIGLNAFGILLSVVPTFAIGYFWFGLKIAAFSVFVLFFVSMALGFLIAFLMSFLVGLTAFWFKEISGLRRVRRALTVFLSGGMIPLSFFPEALQRIFEFLPFQYIRYTSINIYLQKYSLTASLWQLCIQLIWVLGMFFLVKLIWNVAVKKFAGEGT